jgi:micrococcal nuclease
VAFLSRALGCILAASLACAGAAPAEPAARVVTRVVDGDTLVLDGGEKVRLIGVDAPETVHPDEPVGRLGRAASAFTRRVAEGRSVRVESDAKSGARDRYGRSLAYVWLSDGTLLNLELIRQGYGFAYTRFPFARMDDFRRAEREARAEQRGLWADEAEAAPATRPSASPAPTPRDCIPREQCCKVCSTGQACGASCISRAYTCRKGRGCACNADELCR